MRLDIKTALIILLAIAIVVLSTCNSCKLNSYVEKIAELEAGALPSVKSDTVYHIDTVKTVVDNPIPYETVRTDYKIDWVFDTLYIEGVDTIYVDTLVGRHYATNKYSDTAKVEHGYIVSEETVSENKITQKSIKPFLTIPTITNTITRTEQKAILYFGIDAFANENGLNGGGLSLMFKSKKTLAYELGAYWNDQNKINYRAGLKFPLTLHLKK